MFYTVMFTLHAARRDNCKILNLTTILWCHVLAQVCVCYTLVSLIVNSRTQAFISYL